MKKSVLLFVGLLLTAVSAIAQPAKPQVEFTTWGEGEFYLYNVEAGMFLTNGNAWSQRACFVTGGSNSNIISYDSFIAGQGEFKGVKWNIMAATDSRGLDANNDEFCYTIHNTTDAAFNLAAAAGNSVWADGGPDRAEKEVDGWFLVSQNKSEKTFQLGYIRKNAKTDGEGQVIEGEYEYVVEGGQETPYVLGAYKFDEGDIDTYINESRAYSTWALVDATEYARVEPLFQLYYEGLRLKKLLDDAKELGITADFSAYEATLKKDGVTLEELQEAISKVRPTVEFGKVIAEAKVKDPNRSWAKFETIYADPASTDEIFTANTKLINALLDLKKAIDEGKAQDASHSYATAEGIYASDESAQDAIEAETNRVKAFISLKTKLDAATTDYPSLDFSEAKAAYDKLDSTVDELAAAEALIAELTAQYDLEHASVDKPGDITSQLTNVDGKSATDWVRTWTGDGRVGDFHLNTWSGEANNGADGTNMTTNFLEDWVAKGSILSDQKFQRNPVTVAPGAYKITGNIRIYNESGAEYMKGAYLFGNVNRNSLFANDDEAQTNAIEGAKYNTYNNMLNYWKDGFEAYTIVPENGSLTFGIIIEGANYNWVAAKDFRVYYMGDTYESLDYVRKNSDMFAQSFPEGTIAMKQMLEDYDNAVENYGKATNAKDLSDAVQTLVTLADDVQANVNAYKAYYDRVIELREGEFDLVGDDADILFDYIAEGCEEFGPESDEAMEYGFANGYADYILTNCPLTTEEITAELTFLNTLYDNAVRTSLQDGSDLTNLIVNPGFEEAGGKGWSLDTSKGGTGSLTNWHGGSSTNYCAEAYEQNFDVYQVIEGVKDGLYEVSVQAFYRGGWPADAYKNYKADPEKTGAAKVYSEVYLNTFSTPIRNVMEITFDSNLANNCSTFTEKDDEDQDYSVYVPNGMASASSAFSLPDNNKNYTMSAYGIVTDGKIRLGIRRLTTPPSNSGTWTLWDNFKLTYRAKNPTVAGEVLKIKIDELSKLIAANAETNMTDPAVTAANKALNKAKNVLDESMNYETLIETNDALVAAQENVTVVEAYKTIQKKYDDACSELELSDPDAEEAIWDDIDNMDNESGINDGDDAFKDFTTAELTDLSSRMEQLTEAINAVMDAIKAQPMLEDLAGATDEAPKDVTKYMVNPDFETGNLDGWTYYKGGDTKAAENSNGTYTINDERVGSYVFNTWNGSVPSEGFWVAQTVKCLPAGTYLLTAILASDANNVITLSANDASADFTMVGDKATAYDASLIFTIGGDQTSESPLRKVQATTNVEIKAKSNSWFKADNFQLTYYGTDSDVTPTAIDVIDAQPATAKNGKYMQDGQLIILKNGKKYNAMGVLLR